MIIDHNHPEQNREDGLKSVYEYLGKLVLDLKMAGYKGIAKKMENLQEQARECMEDENDN